MTPSQSILIVDTAPGRARRIVDSLGPAAGCELLVLTDDTDLARKIAARRPDIVLIGMPIPTPETLARLILASGPLERPVVVFVDQSDPALTKAAIVAGVSAYVVDGLHADRIRPVLDAAAARFQLVQNLRTELAATKRALEDRKIIEKAKSILMRSKRIPEDQAYVLLRKAAMDQGRKLTDVAEALVTAAGLLA